MDDAADDDDVPVYGSSASNGSFSVVTQKMFGKLASNCRESTTATAYVDRGAGQLAVDDQAVMVASAYCGRRSTQEIYRPKDCGEKICAYNKEIQRG